MGANGSGDEGYIPPTPRTYTHLSRWIPEEGEKQALGGREEVAWVFTKHGDTFPEGFSGSR